MQHMTTNPLLTTQSYLQKIANKKFNENCNKKTNKS